MSDLPVPGFCFICNSEVDADLATHLSDAHPAVERKIRGAKINWQDRITNVIGVLEQLKEDPDIDRLDIEVLQELHLVRVRLAQLRGTPVTRVKEGAQYGSD